MAKEKRLKSDEIVVVLITGSGLKDIDSVLKVVKKPHYIKPDINDVGKILV